MLQLASGAARLPAATLERHAAFVGRLQSPDGGFPGRDGVSDLYYTGFALRSLAITGRLDGAVAEGAGGYLRSRLAGQAPIVDFLSLIYSAALLQAATEFDVFAAAPAGWQTTVARALEALRRPDGGYAKTAAGEGSSLYHSFLVTLCQQLLGIASPDVERLVAFVHSRHREDGGFVEMEPMRRSGANPTAAAVGLLSIHGGWNDELQSATTSFLLGLANEEGGWRANGRVPIADLLSTFTAIVSLADLQAADEIDLTAAQRYAESLQDPAGGFHGAVWDGGLDVEYTFYGLGVLAYIAELRGDPPQN
jgi:geranylgeranyl transferase type-2 subunit beta